MKKRKNQTWVIWVLAGCIVVGCVLAGVIWLRRDRQTSPVVPDEKGQSEGEQVVSAEKEQNEKDTISQNKKEQNEKEGAEEETEENKTKENRAEENGAKENGAKENRTEDNKADSLEAADDEDLEPYEISISWEEPEFLPEPLTFTEEQPEFKAEGVLWERSGAECFTGGEVKGVEKVILWQNASGASLTFALSEGNGYQTLFLPERPENPSYLKEVEVLGYQEVCGSSGYRVDRPADIDFSRAYYGFRDGRLEPVLQGYNGVFEVDCDGDGQIEVISCYGDITQSRIYDEQDGELLQCNVNQLLEKSILERTGITREIMVYYMEEAKHFVYKILAKKNEAKEEFGRIELTEPSLLLRIPDRE